MRELKNMGGEERTTVVDRAKLLARLKDNRDAHVAEYEAAVEGYLSLAREKIKEQYAAALAELDKARVRAEQELEVFDPAKAQDSIVFCRGISFNLTAPRCYQDAYDQAIEMLEWDTREVVELNATEFRCFVMNKWDWMQSFKAVSETYNSFAGRK